MSDNITASGGKPWPKEYLRPMNAPDPEAWAQASKAAGATPVEFATPPQPAAGDEAAIGKIAESFLAGASVRGMARAVLDAIKAGKVPGVWFGALDNWTMEQADEIARLKADSSQWEAMWKSTESLYEQVRDDRHRVIAELARLKADNDRLRGELAAANAGRNASADGYRETIREIAQERDRLRAELAAEKERADRSEEGYRRERRIAESTQQRAMQYINERDTATARVAELEADLAHAEGDLREAAIIMERVSGVRDPIDDSGEHVYAAMKRLLSRLAKPQAGKGEG